MMSLYRIGKRGQASNRQSGASPAYRVEEGEERKLELVRHEKQRETERDQIPKLVLLVVRTKYGAA